MSDVVFNLLLLQFFNKYCLAGEKYELAKKIKTIADQSPLVGRLVCLQKNEVFIHELQHIFANNQKTRIYIQTFCCCLIMCSFMQFKRMETSTRG